MLQVFRLILWRPVPFLFCVSFFLFFQLRLGSQSIHNYCRSINSTLVCTGQRLVRARVVLWSTPRLARMKHFAIFSSAMYTRDEFFHLGYGIHFFQACLSSTTTRANPGFYEANKLDFYQSAGGLKIKNKKKKQKKGKLTKLGIPGWFLNKIGYLFFRDGAR